MSSNKMLRRAQAQVAARPARPAISREDWLKRAVRVLRPLLERKAGVKMRARWQVSMSLASNKAAIGQCWYEGNSATGQTVNIMICPTHENAWEVLDTLLHEMVHASLPRGTHHGPKFVKACKAVGLTKGKPTEAAAGPELMLLLDRIARHLGTFPHDPMKISRVKAKGTKGGYWPVFVSPQDPRYRIQISAKALAVYGPPICPLSGLLMSPAEGRAPRWED